MAEVATALVASPRALLLAGQPHMGVAFGGVVLVGFDNSSLVIVPAISQP